MRLADCIEQNTDVIVDAAEVFVSTQLPARVHLDSETLRDHLPQILAVIVADLRETQSDREELERAEGHRDTPSGPLSPAQLHGGLRAKTGFSINHLVAEYRALRASVLRLWAALQPPGPESFEDMMRFNQAIDQAIAESVAHHADEEEAWRQIFLGVLGHDLRGPLSAILLTSDLISKMTTDTPLSKQAKRLIKSGERMSALLDDLLDYSRTSLGIGIRITRSDSDLAAELGDEVEMLRTAWPQMSIEFHAPGPVRGNFDASRLREAVANLVNNAAKYGIADGKVSVALEHDSSHVVLSVRNKGGAIPKATLATMFEPLHRGNKRANAEDGASLGLGLFVVREIAKAHGGDVTAESTGDSTTFAMHLRDASGLARIEEDRYDTHAIDRSSQPSD
jgi:signal transduction histidine kinase